MKIYSTIAFFILFGFLAYSYNGYLDSTDGSATINEHFIPVKYNSEESIDTLVRSDTFKKALLGKEIVGIGEATHGTAEFRQTFVNLTKSLIKYEGFNVVFFAEKEYQTAIELNQFVLGLNDSIPVTMLMKESTEYEINLVSWIKAYNKTKAEKDKIWILCGELYSSTGLAKNILSLCETNNVILSKAQYSLLYDIAFMPYGLNFHDKKYDYNYINNIINEIETKVSGIKSEGSFKKAILLNTFNVFKNDLKIIYFKDEPIRDTNMFELMEWTKQLRSNAKIIVFAHNSHVEKVQGNIMTSASERRLGKLIYHKYKEKYYTIAMEVEQGFYSTNKSKEPTEICTSSNKIGNIIGKNIDATSGFLDLKSNKEVYDFFSKSRNITYGVNNTKTCYYAAHKNTSEAFDGLFWVKNSTPFVKSALFLNSITVYINPEKYNIKDSIDVAFNIDYKKYYEKESYDDIPNLLVIFFDKKEQIITYTGLPLNNNSTRYALSIPKNTANIGVQFSANNLYSFSLKKLQCNHIPINLKKAYFAIANYVVERDSAQFNLKIKDIFTQNPKI